MQEKPITRGQIAAFSLPSIPVAALSLPLIVYLPPFYTQDVGLNFTIVGMIFMLVRLADVAADPMIGFVTDKFPSRWGRRRHWLAISVPLLMVTTWLLFMPIMPVTALQLTLVLFVLYISWSLLAITHMSWGAELSDDYNERSTIQGARTAMLIFGMLTVLALPAIIERTAGVTSGFDKMAAMGWFIVIFTPLTVFVASRITGERKHVRHEQHIPWRKAWAILLRNKILLRLLLANLLVGVGPGITGVLYIFFTTHVFGLGQSASFLLLIYFAAGFLGVPLWIKLSHKIGKHRTLSIAMIYGALTLPMLLILPHENFWWFCGANILYGLAFGATSFLPLSVLADVTDYDNLETGQQRTGLYFSLLSMTGKIGAAVAVGMVYPLLDLIGFDPKGVNTPETLNQLTAIYIGLPSLFMLSVVLCMWNFPLDRAAQEEIRRKIAERDAAQGHVHEPHELADATAAIAEVAGAGGLVEKPAD